MPRIPRRETVASDERHRAELRGRPTLGEIERQRAKHLAELDRLSNPDPVAGLLPARCAARVYLGRRGLTALWLDDDARKHLCGRAAAIESTRSIQREMAADLLRLRS